MASGARETAVEPNGLPMVPAATQLCPAKVGINRMTGS
jgi:hypothetical protein